MPKGKSDDDDDDDDEDEDEDGYRENRRPLGASDVDDGDVANGGNGDDDDDDHPGNDVEASGRVVLTVGKGRAFACCSHPLLLRRHVDTAS